MLRACIGTTCAASALVVSACSPHTARHANSAQTEQQEFALIREVQERSTHWFERRSVTTREILRSLNQYSNEEVTAPRPLFTRARYKYFERPERGYPLPELRRTDAAGNEEIVYSPSFGKGGYPFILQHYALCADETRVALTGKVGPLHTLCVRDPKANQLSCSARDEDIGGIAWSSDCGVLYYSQYENGRAHSLIRTDPTQLEEIQVIYNENDVAFSLSLVETEDQKHLLLRSASAVDAEISLITEREGKAILQPILSRTTHQLASLHRAFDKWWVLKGGTSGPTALQQISNLSDLTKRIPLTSLATNTPLTQIYGFKNFMAAVVREHGRPQLLIIDREGLPQSVPLAPEVTRIRILPAQNYNEDYVRVALGSPLFPTRVCHVNLQEVRCDPLALPKIPYIVEHLSAQSEDGTRIPVTLIRPSEVSTASALLRVYGAYGVSLDPEFDVMNMALLAHGVPIAYGHVRGGGEQGLDWHHTATGTNRLKSAQDTIAVARMLTQQLRATPILYTRSAGAITAMLSLRHDPQLFRGAILESPLLDVRSILTDPGLPSAVREYTEWGTPADPEVQQFWNEELPRDANFIRGKVPVLVSVGGQDEAVPAMESLRWVARSNAPFPHTNEWSDAVPFLLQWDETGTHAGARHVVDDQLRIAQRINTILEFGKYSR